MKLTPRLKIIADLVPKGNVVADIGTDHAYLPVYLIKNNIANKVIAIDINAGPLDNAKKNIKRYNLQNNIETRIGSGLQPIRPNEIDAAIIAGMGGLLVIDILEQSKDVLETIDTLILQPMVAQDEVRKWLHKNNFKIDNEKLAKEGNKLYEIMVVSKGEMYIQDSIYYEIGIKLIDNKDPYLCQFIDEKLKKYYDILKNVEEQKTLKAKEKLLECQTKIKKLKEVKECL
ncbi:tRNA (adenine(22)-N(1))-methyltransferase [Paramaledivibacter caminithermalis]|jgi:tRNA (adenine22-N1)-methyltransferase|uniref:tRNA (Adenine22-N1)-methyltransferase n=1 Tax=Paramaledivibacter caminithermalis (strain DSM 15212 / CIP 107654 / DViRD3) TaxID=1121301 RepID=A0A1M6M8Q4_PARC5|nr:class I SAM-dependent methyltransferase [Paramaledivibacter caminithermalis]SHJ79653.1 tRNA (adenine22-N1)-methyltransferase [Paramaledivibacter caminithermalis DSM 15212]